MKAFRKALLSVLALVLVSVISIGATLAYLQHEDGAVNVMTVGKATIKQHEYQRAEGVAHDAGDLGKGNGIKKGDLVPFVQGQQLLPAVPTTDDAYIAEPADADLFFWGDYVYSGTAGNGLWDDNNLSNVMDKFVFVENTGAVDVYFRTVIALECPEGMAYSQGPDKEFMMNVNGSSLYDWETIGYTVIDGTRYHLEAATYQNALKPGQTAHPSLLQVVMTHNATNEDIELLGNSYEILVMSQAVQAGGFKDADTALNAAFGELKADENNPADDQHPWVEGVELPPIVYTAAELQAALDNATDGTVILLGDDITGNVTVSQKPDTKLTIEGANHVFAGTLLVDGKSGTYTTAGLTIKNITFKADSLSSDACIDLGKEDDNNTRYTCNVTVSGCTFDVPGAVGVKSYTGGDKNLTITGCTATANAHSLVQAKGIDGILVEGCKVYSKNGMNFNNSDNVTVLGCTVDVKGYAVRFGESAGGVGAAETYLIKDSSLKSASDDGDAVIILRGTADYSTLTIENTTVTAATAGLEIKNTATGATVVQ